MVWIYGGIFVGGAAQESTFGPDYLITKDVTVVALNYRVGILGFFSLDDPSLGVTGNAGLKDQVLALKWVKDNIEYFGGDPNNILIFGQSAGSMSVHLQIMSPMSQGLFNKAIFQSGSVFTDLVVHEVRNNGVLLAEALEVKTDDWKEMLESLRALPTSAIASGSLMLFTANKFSVMPLVEVESSEASFLPQDPLDIIRSGNYNQIPFITGVTDAEGLMYHIEERQATGESFLITDFTEWIPFDFHIESGSEMESILSEKIKYFYYGDTEPSRDDITGAVELSTDYTFAFPAYRSILEHLRTAENPMYYYIFSADTKLNFFKHSDEVAAAFPGAAHADDLGYLFHHSWTTGLEPGSVEDIAMRNMVALWTNFAIYSDPTPEGFYYKWEPVQEGQFNYLHIDSEETTLKVDPSPERMQFWSDIFAEYFPRK